MLIKLSVSAISYVWTDLKLGLGYKYEETKI